ncbi:UNKNOWN [Stylonychia lemnae]|uniref:Uncharacterized protein n=1 Tax=Stylonychia lemnae TaxID=5949 RepID=A0A078ABE5_STYLE|nr:UNKNOWN [Stylonychia lemnae]|eukprot:CDW78887.1 UNKNOWN [Stylonychia lemnae]
MIIIDIDQSGNIDKSSANLRIKLKSTKKYRVQGVEDVYKSISLFLAIMGIMADLLVIYILTVKTRQASRGSYQHHIVQDLGPVELLYITLVAIAGYALIHFTINVIIMFQCFQANIYGPNALKMTNAIIWNSSLVLGSIYLLVAAPLSMFYCYYVTDILTILTIVGVFILFLFNTGSAFFFNLYALELRK